MNVADDFREFADGRVNGTREVVLDVRPFVPRLRRSARRRVPSVTVRPVIRGARVIAVASEGDEDISKHADHVLFVPRVPELFAPSS